jgi:hypothetical protein
MKFNEIQILFEDLESVEEVICGVLLTMSLNKLGELTLILTFSTIGSVHEDGHTDQYHNQSKNLHDDDDDDRLEKKGEEKEREM